MLFGRRAAETGRAWCRLLDVARAGEWLSIEGVVGADLPWIYEVEYLCTAKSAKTMSSSLMGSFVVSGARERRFKFVDERFFRLLWLEC